MYPKSCVRNTRTATSLCSALTLVGLISWLKPISPERFTHTQLFRDYSWLSDAFLSGTWVEAATETKGLKSYGEFLLNLDHQVPLATSVMYSDSEWRALLGLDNIYAVERDQVGTNSRAMAKCWTTVAEIPGVGCLISRRNTGHPICRTKQAESLSTWPARIAKFQTSWGKQVDQERKESKKKGRTPSGAAVAGTSSSGPAPDCEAWGLVQQLSGMTTKSLVQKTTKNLQAMGTALTWIIESRNAPDDLCPTTVCVDALYGTTPIAGAATASLTVVELLRPLSYAINSSFLSAFCDLDLQKEYGHVMHQYETRMFLGRYRTPRLAYMEDLVLTVVRDIAIGNPAASAIRKFLSPDSTYLKNMPPANSEDEHIFMRKSTFLFLQSVNSWTLFAALESRESLPDPDLSRKRTRTKPLQLDIPPSSSGRTIATALASSPCIEPQGWEGVTDTWSSLISFEEVEPTDNNADVVGSSVTGAVSGSEAASKEAVHSSADGRDGHPLPADGSGTKQKKRSSARPGRSDNSSAKLKARLLTKGAGERGPDAVEDAEQTEAEGSSNKRKNRSDHKTPKSKKRKTTSTRTDNSVSLKDVEAAPPKISTETVAMWGYRPDGSKRSFSFPLHENSEHMEKPMLEQLQQAIERQQRSFGDAAFVRHTPGHLPTERARADEPNFYVLSKAEWTAMSRHERVTLYQTGRNLFISGMTIGDLNDGVEESISILHRLDEEIEVQGKAPVLIQGGLTDNYYSQRFARTACFDRRRNDH
ncbi:hypothetical protein B0H14DRAFT_2575178 [Mycena olivaceomarginata]|nr:hypothetical protein B0H14DRAFT_2575178 [Mycena olivaceomarginata]